MKRLLRRSILRFAELVGLDKTAVITGQIMGQKLAVRQSLPNLAAAEFSVFSQWGEDGIISWLIDRTRCTNDCFVEFGVEDFHEANCRYLLITRNWRGLVIDGSDNNITAIRRSTLSWKYDLQSQAAFITRDTIVGLIASAGFGPRLGLLSVDIDGVDYWVLERIQNPCDIVVVEYNDLFSGHPISVPYDPAFARLQKDPSGMYWGASLDAFRYILEGRGYVFVGTNRAGTNAFFVAGEYRELMQASLEEMRAWPCRMREVRNKDGSLTLKTYRECAERIASLPVVNVVTGQSLCVGDILR